MTISKSIPQGGYSSEGKCRCSRKTHHNPLDTRGLLLCLPHDPGHHAEGSQRDQDVSLRTALPRPAQEDVEHKGIQSGEGISHNVCWPIIPSFSLDADL